MVPDPGQSLAHAAILLIGNDSNSRDTIHSILTKGGYSVSMVDTGAAAIQMIAPPLPKLIVIDQQVNPMRGVEICKQFGANPQFRDVPILLVGMRSDAEHREWAFKTRGADWLDSPVQGSELLAKVQTHLDLHQMRASQSTLKHQLALVQEKQTRIEEESKASRDHFETLLRSRTEELTKAKEQAESAVRAKSTFLSHMSHELRTPLNAILGFSRLMEKNPNLTETQSENLGLIYQSGENLLRLINDVLEMSRIDTGTESLAISAIDLPQLMQGVVVMFKSRAAEQGLTFSLDLAPDLPRYVRCDEHKLQQILINLADNSLKFTRSGGVEIKVRCAWNGRPDQSANNGKTDGSCDLVFEVQDTGPGIAVDDFERIFDPFFKARSHVTSNRGTGLGLTISQNFARLMGGDITAANCRDHGACFTFRVCLETATADEALKKEKPTRIISIAPGSRDYRVLVVDDDLTSRMLLGEILIDVGLEVEKAEDGEQAVELFSHWQPDIVFMDMRMPGMDGLTATRHIKTTERGRQTPVIALTGQVLEEDRRNILSAGCDDYLTKPLEEQQLFEVLTKHLDVDFIRESRKPRKDSPVKETAITIETMAQLPVPLLTELRKIALELDLEKLKGHLDQIQTTYPALGASLSKLSNNFRFEEIYNLCEGALKGKG